MARWRGPKLNGRILVNCFTRKLPEWPTTAEGTTAHMCQLSSESTLISSTPSLLAPGGFSREVGKRSFRLSQPEDPAEAAATPRSRLSLLTNIRTNSETKQDGQREDLPAAGRPWTQGRTTTRTKPRHYCGVKQHFKVRAAAPASALSCHNSGFPAARHEPGVSWLTRLSNGLTLAVWRIGL